MEPVRLEILLDDKTLKGMRSVEGNLSGIGLYAKQVIAQLEQELLELQKQYRNAMAAGTNTDAQMADIQALQGVIRQLKAELQGLEEQKKKTGSTPLMGDDPAPKLNNVRMSMQQIARELPSLAMGPQMFFLAISNNIPMFTDALSSARKEYEALTKAGKKATPVWKQVLSSLFSWQTAMATLITLSVVYGKEIGGWVKSLFGVKDAALSAAKAQEKVNESFRNSSSDVAEQVTLVRFLSERWKELGDNMSDKKQFITENKKKFEKLGVEVGNVNDAEKLLVSNTDVFIGAMVLRAEAAASFKLATEQTEKALKKQNEIEERRKKGPTLWDRFRANFFSSASGSATYTRQADAPTAEQLIENDISALKEEQKAAEDTAKSYMDLSLARTKEWKKRLKSAGIKEYYGRKTKDTGKSARDYQDELADARIRAQQKLEAARISVMREGVRKRQALARQELDESLAQIDKEERDTLKKMDKAEKKRGVKSTPGERQAVRDNASQQRALATMGYLKESYNIEKEFRDRNLREWVEYYKEYGTYQEKRAALDKEYNHKIGRLYEERRKAEAEGDAAGAESLDLQIARATRDKGKELIKLDYKQLTESPDYIRAFENLRETSTDTLNSLLEQFGKARQAAAQVLSPDDLREYTTTIREIMDELDSRNPFQALADRKKELAEAERELAEARRNLETVNAGGQVSTGVRYNDRTGKMDKTYLTATAAMERYNKAQDKVAGSSSKVRQTEAKVEDVVKDLSRAFSDVGDAIGGQAGEIISLIGDIGVFAMTAMSGVTTASTTASSAVRAVERASVILTIISAAIQVATKIASLFKDDDGVAEYERAKEVYESYIDILDRVIEKQKELFELNSETGKQAYSQAVETVRKQSDAARELGRQYLNAGASKGFLGVGSKSSHGVSQREDITSEAWAQAKAALGGAFYTYGIGDGRMTGLFDLSVEQLEKLQAEAPLFWAQLHSDTQDYLNRILESNEALAELENERLSGLTKVDLSGFEDSFVDMLTDMDSKSKDFADNFEEYLQRAILSSLITDKYQSRIQELYKRWAGYTESGNKLTGDEAQDLRDEYNDIVSELLKERDEYSKVFGWTSSSSSSQSGRSGTVTSMTEETAGRLEGIGNATLDHVISIDNNLTRNLEGMATSLGKIAGNSEYLRHLETINGNIAELRRGVKLKT
ncbi:hypothetical protein [Phocaeicola sartorii]|uniref:hypothetical protein n=1 Tax=Phocaeicola sartorii TaxID=671267 RepID=UPI00248B56B2|nr:hypothetical protein [Phocaeicola sartorii]